MLTLRGGACGSSGAPAGGTGLWLAPHKLLQPADAADHRMYIVLRGKLRVFGNDSVGTVGVGGYVGQLAEQEYHHTGTHCAGEDGCMLGVLFLEDGRSYCWWEPRGVFSSVPLRRAAR